MMICKAGTALGERTMAAMETCSDTAVAEGRARKGKGNGKKPKPNKGKGKGKDKCPSVDKLEAMAEEKMKSMEKKYKKCMEKYDDEEKARLDELFTGIAETECFMAVFKKSCGSYVKNNLPTIFGGMLPAAGRK